MSVKCVFGNSAKEYTYETLIEDLQPGDKVVATGKKGLCIITVVAMSNDPVPTEINNHPITPQYVIAKVDAATYDAACAARGGHAVDVD